jgi:hypothetical protein
MRRLGNSIMSTACLAALATVATGCGDAPPPRPAIAAVAAAAMPLGTATTTAAGTWATVVMGGSAAQHNNFWQLFIRPTGSTQWKLVTPPGTADNGGLVLAAGAGQALITAFRPSQDLTYTPLTQTIDGGKAWSALSPLNAALASTPGSLTVQPSSGRLLALLSSGTAEQSAPSRTTWTTLVTARKLAATRAGRSCGLRTLTAVAYSPAGTPLLAGTCSRPGFVGIFAAAGQTWQSAGPLLPGALARQPVTVLLVSGTTDQVAALLAAGTGQRAALIAAWSAAHGSRWTISPPLRTGRHAVAAESLGPGQTAAVITADGQGSVLARGRWRSLPALPPGTAALAPGADGTVDALAVHEATLTVWQLAAGRAWARVQVISVPVQYGSSS